MAHDLQSIGRQNEEIIARLDRIEHALTCAEHAVYAAAAPGEFLPVLIGQSRQYPDANQAVRERALLVGQLLTKERSTPV